MSIREIRPGVWKICAYMGVVDGMKRRRYATAYGNKQDARAAERDLQIRSGGKAKLNVYELTFADYLNTWLAEYVEPYKPPSTLESYIFSLKRLVPHIKGLLLRKLAPRDLQRAYAAIGKEVSSSSVRNTHRVVHAALERAVKNDLVPYNVADRVELPPAKKFRPVTLTPADAVKLLDVAKGTPHYELVAVALLTGMRLGELQRLTWADVDLAGMSLTVEKSKTEAGERIIYLPLSAVAVLSDLNARRRPLPSDHVFIGKTGNSIYAPSMSKEYLRHLTEKAGLPRMRFHDLRHTHATWLSAVNLNPRTVADRLGHTDPSFTMRTYAHMSTDAQRQAAALVDDILRLPEIPENQTPQ